MYIKSKCQGRPNKNEYQEIKHKFPKQPLLFSTKSRETEMEYKLNIMPNVNLFTNVMLRVSYRCHKISTLCYEGILTYVSISCSKEKCLVLT